MDGFQGIVQFDHLIAMQHRARLGLHIDIGTAHRVSHGLGMVR